MKAPKKHPEEKLRLRALKSLEILDTEAEKEYDDIVFLASQICQTPIASISLVDESRQWFKAEIGLNVKETERDISFCGHAINQDEIFVVENALKHEDFKDNPLVANGPKIRFYAGHPIHDPKTQLPIGTLCVIDHVSRSLTKEQTRSLQILARQVEYNLKLRNKVEIVENEKLTSLIKLSKEIAHDINTPLTVIRLNANTIASLLQQPNPDLQKAISKSNTIDATVEKISNIIVELKSFYNQDTTPVKLKKY